MSPTNCSRRRSCVNQAPSCAFASYLGPLLPLHSAPVLAKDEHQGPISAPSEMITLVIRPLLLRRYWRGTWPRNEHTFIMRGKVESAAVITNTHPVSLVAAGAGGSPVQSWLCVVRLACRAERLRYELRGGLHRLINGSICLTLIIESCHLKVTWGRHHPPRPASSDKPGS